MSHLNEARLIWVKQTVALLFHILHWVAHSFSLMLHNLLGVSPLCILITRTSNILRRFPKFILNSYAVHFLLEALGLL